MHYATIAILTGTLAAAARTPSVDGGVPYPAYRPGAPVTIDGKLQEKSLQGLVAATNFKVFKQMKLAGDQTYFRMGWDKDFLYIGVRCAEPSMDKVRSTVPDGGYVLTEDSVEIFIASEEIYEHFAVNPIGSRWNRGKCRNWQAAAVRGRESWTLEAKIPFRELGGMPESGTTWKVNVFRNATDFASGKRKWTSWSPVRTGAHDADRFRGIAFRDRALDAEEAAAHTERYNAVSEQELQEELREAANTVFAKCRDQAAEVESDAASTRFGDTLTRLATRLRAKSSLEKLDAVRLEAEALHAEIIKFKMKMLVDSK